jgi:hypothetical protein
VLTSKSIVPSLSALVAYISFFRLYQTLLDNAAWMADVHAADAVLIATHSQGSIVSTHLLDRLIRDGHLVTTATYTRLSANVIGDGVDVPSRRRPQKICCLAICAPSLGPLRYLSTSSLVLPYIQVRPCRSGPVERWSELKTQYFESAAARELFEFQVRLFTS